MRRAWTAAWPWLRRLLKTVAWLFGIAVLSVAGLLVWLHTDHGRRFVKGKIEQSLSAEVQGEVRIGALKGSVLDGPSLHDIEVMDENGNKVIGIAKISTAYSLLPLIQKRVKLGHITIEKPWARVRVYEDGTNNLQRLIPPPKDKDKEEPDKPSTPSAWKVFIGAVTVEDGYITYVEPNERVNRVSPLNIGVKGIEVRGADITTRSFEVTARWMEEMIDLTVRGKAALEADTLMASAKASAKQGETTMGEVRVDNAEVQLDLAKVAATLHASLPSRTMRRLQKVDQGPWPGGVAITVHATRSSVAEPIHVDVGGVAAGAELAVTAEVTPESKRARVSAIIADLVPGAMAAEQQPGSFDARIDAEVTGTSLDDLQAVAHVNAGGHTKLPERPDKVVIRDVDGHARLDMGALRFRASVASDSHRLTGSARGLIDILAEPIAIRYVFVRGFAGALRLLVPDADLRGRGRINAVASGNVEEIDISGTGRASGVRQKEVRVASATARFRLSGPVDKLHGQANVNAGRVLYGVEKLDAVSVTARTKDGFKKTAVNISVGTRRSANRLRGGLTVELDPNRTRVKVGWMRGRVRGLKWDTSGGSSVDVLPDGNVRVRGLKVESKVGSLRAEGSLFGGLRVWAKRIRIAEIAKAMEMPPPYPQGIIDIEGKARQVGTSFRGNASGTVAGFALERNRPTLSGDFSATLQRRRATATAKLSGRGIGTIDFEADTRTPRDQFNPVHWERFGARAMRSARANLSDVRVAGLMAFMGEPRVARGRITGSLRVDDEMRRVVGEISASRVRMVGVKQRANGSARITAEAGRLVLQTFARGRGLGSVDGRAEMHIPTNLLAFEQWKGITEYSIVGARFEAKKLSLTRLRSLVPTMPPVKGTVAGSLVVSKHARDATVIGTVTKLYNARTAERPVDATVRAVIDDTSTNVSLQSRIKGTPLANGTASLNAGIQTLRTGGVEAVQKASLRASAKLLRLPLRMVADAAQLELRERISGGITASARVSGTPLDPRVVATADLSGARVDRVKFRSFDVKAELGDKALVATAIAKQRHGGRLDAFVTVQRDGKQKVSGSVSANDFELAFLRGLDRDGESVFAGIGGRAFAAVALAGDAENVEPSGTMRLRNGTMRLPDMVPLRDISMNAKFDLKKAVATLSARSGAGTLNANVDGTLTDKQLSNVVVRVKTRRYPYDTGTQTVKIDSDTNIIAKLRGTMWDVNTRIARATVRIPDPLDAEVKSRHTIKSMSDLIFLDDPKRRRRRRKLNEVKKVARDSKPTLRMKISAPGTIRLRGEDDLIKASASANLTITIIDDVPIIEGVVRTSRGRDRVKILDRYYSIDRARITFDGRVPADPRINVEISHAFDSLTLRVAVRGRASKIEPPQFTSDPGGYDRATLLGFFLGRDPDNPNTEDIPVSEQVLEAVSGYFASKIQDSLRDILPVSFDVVDVQFEDGNTSQLSRVRFGKWINDDLFVAYIYSPAADDISNINEAQLEYRLSRRWSLEGTYGDRGKGGLDILWIRRY